MQFIIDFIDFFVNIIETIWSFFMSLVENLILLVKYLGIAVRMCYDCIAMLPSWLQAFAFLTITVSVLYMILGRQGGKD